MIVGIGVDAIDIERIARMFADRGERLLQRLFTAGEIDFLRTKPFPNQHIAVRLAAKEAAFKALRGNDLATLIGWRDIEVVTQPDGSPSLRFHGRATARFDELSATTAHVSLSHSAITAVAVVVIER